MSHKVVNPFIAFTFCIISDAFKSDQKSYSIVLTKRSCRSHSSLSRRREHHVALLCVARSNGKCYEAIDRTLSHANVSQSWLLAKKKKSDKKHVCMNENQNEDNRLILKGRLETQEGRTLLTMLESKWVLYYRIYHVVSFVVYNGINKYING